MDEGSCPTPRQEFPVSLWDWQDAIRENVGRIFPVVSRHRRCDASSSLAPAPFPATKQMCLYLGMLGFQLDGEHVIPLADICGVPMLCPLVRLPAVPLPLPPFWLQKLS